MRKYFVVAAAALLMGNTIEVGHGPRLVKPRPLEKGSEVTVEKGALAIEADVLEVDSIVLKEPLEFRQSLLQVTLPPGTVLGSFITLKSKEWDRNDKVYCSLRLEVLLGGAKAFPSGLSRTYPMEQRLCFYRNQTTNMLEHAFVASGKGNYGAIFPIKPVPTTRPAEFQATGVTIGLKLDGRWKKGSIDRVKFVLVFGGADGDIEGRRIGWKRQAEEGETLWLTMTGDAGKPLPETFKNIFGVYDLTIVSADSKTDTVRMRVDAVHEPALFVDVKGSYQMRTLYLTY